MRGFYERLGWRRVECDVLLDPPAGKLPSPFHVMTLPFKPEFEIIDGLDVDSAPW